MLLLHGLPRMAHAREDSMIEKNKKTKGRSEILIVQKIVSELTPVVRTL